MALVIRRLRGAGVVLALSFHFLLAVDPASHVWDFSSALLPLFVLFLPAGFHRLIDGVVGRWRGRPAVERLASIGLVVALQATSLVGPLPDWLPAYPLWLAIGGAVTVAAARFVIGADGGLRWTLGGTGPDDGRRWSLGVVIVLVIGLANGLAPYAEVRTAAAFNMYSNLRIVDGDSNHFVVPALPVGLHRPMAALEDPGPDSELAFYHSAGMIVPMENLTRYATDHRDEVVVGRVGEGQSVLVEPAAGGVMGRLVDGLETKLAFRRALDADEPAACLRSWGPIG